MPLHLRCAKKAKTRMATEEGNGEPSSSAFGLLRIGVPRNENRRLRILEQEKCPEISFRIRTYDPNPILASGSRSDFRI
ncbi:hypothetical protein Taro_022370 [Colocasia esculenta]|uniref:Uncharacterized protein n=1 Tax=Colocasia esculenta TaxID=4460 RepID=A0A843VB55_COLES|nr:hypothetical protein [Colocasia esculenta]